MEEGGTAAAQAAAAPPEESVEETPVPATLAAAANPAPPPAPSPLSGGYLLIVIGEPHCEEHTQIILQRLAKGFLSWNADICHVDLEKELSNIASQAPEGEEARSGERLIQFASESLVTEVLIQPQTSTLLQCTRNLLSSFTRHRHIIHAGYTFAGSGSWALQDGTFSVADFLEALQEPEAQRVIRAYENSVSIDIHCSPEGDWNETRLRKEICTKGCQLRVNPDDQLSAGSEGISGFTKYISKFIKPAGLEQLLEPSDVVGNIRFSHPTLYVFPGGQGDAALFGINGFNMLVDGGFSRKSCFWDFTRHLDRLDAVMVTRINNSNINGITSVLKRKRVGQVYPQIGHFFCNITERKNLPSPDGDKDRDSLLIDLLEEGHEMVVNLRQLDLKPHACYRDIVTEPINLYHKVGHGKLDLYVISPVKDSKEVKEFLIRWNNCDQKLFSAKTSGADLKFPLQNLVSICALLVWQPANPTDTITRILFPGSTPQHKIFEGLEKLKHLEFLKYPVCTARSLQPHITKTKAKILERTSPDSKIIKNTTSQIESKVAGLETKPLKSTEKSPKISLQSSTTAAVLNGKTEKKQIKSSVTEKPQEHVEKMKNERNKETKDIKLKNDIATKTETKAQIKPKYQSKPTSERKIQRTPSSEKKTEKPSSPTPKKVAESRIRSETKVLVQSKQKPKSSPTSTPAKSAKEANNRKVVESKIQATKQLTSKTTESSGTSTKITDKRYQYKKAKPSSPKKQQKLPTSPSKVSSTKSTPAQSVKSEKDGVIKVEKIVALTNVIADDSQARSTDTTGDNNIEDNVSIKAEETDVLQAEYPLEDMCASQDKIDDDIELRDATVSDDGALEADLKECDLKSEDTDEMKRDDIEDTKENISIVDSQLEEETEDDVELDKKLLDTDERLSEVDAKETDIEEEFELRSDDGENKHVRDEEESEKERKSKDLEEICERKETTNLQDQNNDDALETEEKVEVEEEEEIENELEMQVEADEVKLLSDETKEKIADEVTDIICSAQTVVATQSETKEICEDDVENKMESCTSEEKNQISSEKLRDDGTPEDEIKEQKAGADDGTNTKSQPDEKISAMETSATTAPSMPEDERIPLDEIKEGVEEKYIKEDTKEKEGEIEQREATLPITPKLPEVITSVPFDQQQPTTNQRDIVKTPDEVADLPMHEEVDATPYEIPTEINVKKKVEDVGEEQDTQERELEIVESHRIKSESEEMMLGVVPIVNEDTVDKENEICTKENIDETNMKSDTQIPIQQSDLENGCNDEKLDAKYTSVTNALDEVKIVKTENVEVLQNLVSHADEEDVDSNVKETVLVDDITLDHPNKSLVELSAQVISETALPVSPCENKGDKSDSEKISEERNINTAEVLDTTITAEIANETVLEDQSKLDQTSMPSADLVTNATSEITSSKDLNDGNEEAASHISELKREIINTDKEADTHLFDDVTTNIDNKHQIPSVAEHFVEKDQVVDENVSNKFIEKVEESIKHEPIVAENEKNEIANVELLNEDITTETDTVTPIKETEHMRCEIDATLDQKGIENIMTEDIKSEQILTEQNIMIDVTPEEKVAEKLSSSTIEYQTSIIPGKGLGDSEYASESEQVNQYDIPSKSVFEEEISNVKEKDKYEAISCEQEIVNKQSTTSTDISETSDAKKVIHIHDDDTASSSEGGKLLQEEIVEEHSISTTILNENIVTVQSSVNNMDDKQLHEKDDISDLNLQGVEITRQETIKTAKEETTDISQDSIVIESKEISTAEQTNELEKKLVQQFDETKDKQPDPCIIDNIMVNENEKQLPIDTEKIGGFSITPDTEITKISEGLVRVEEIACKEDIDACVDVDAITVSEKTSDNATITAMTMTQNTVQLEIESQLKDSTPVISKADTQKDTVNDLEGVARDDIPDNALEIDQKCEAISSHKITCEIAAPAQGIIINESLSTEVKDVPITDFEESVDAKIFTAEHIHKKSIDCHNVHGSESSNQNAELENITLFQTEATKESRDDLLANETTLLKSQEAEKDLGKEFDSELESELDKKLELSTETSVLDKLSDKNPSVSLKYDTIPDNSIEVDSKKTEVVEDKSPFVSEEQSSNSDGLDTKETRILEISPNEERVATETNNVAVEEIKEQCLIQSAQAAENFIPILSSTHESERSKETAFDSDEVRTANNELDVTSHLECDIQDTVIESDTYEIENDEKIQYSADESNKLEIGEINQAKSDEDIRREEISADVKTVISDSLACLSDQMSSMTSDRTDVSVIEADAIENVNENQDICVVSSSEFGSIPKENKDDENEVGKTIIESHSPLHENLTDKITYEAEPITSDEPKDDTDASTGKNIETDLLVTEDKFSQESNVQSEVTQEVDSRHQSECKLSTYESTEYHGDLGAESLNISNVEVYEDERATNDLPTPSLKTDDAISHTSQLSLSSTVEDEKCDSQDKEIKTSPQNGVCSTTDISNAAETYITKEEDIISKLRGVTQDDSLKLCSSDDITKPEIECVASYEIDAPKTDNFESIKNTDVDNKFVKQDKITHGTENVGQSIGTNESLEFGLENNTQETLPCTEKMEKDIDKSVSEIAETMVSVDILEMELTGLKYSQSSITETAEKVTPDAKIEEDVDKNVCEPVNEISKKQVSVKVVETELTGSISPQRSGTEIIDKAVPETSTPEERVSDSLSSEIKIAQTKEISSEKLVEPTSESTMRDCTDIIHEKAAGLATDDSDKSIVKESDKTLEELVPEKLNTIRSEEVSDQLTASYLEIIEKLQESTEEEADKQVVANDSETLGSVDTELKTISKIIDDTIIQTEKTCIISNVGAEDASSLVDDKLTQTKGHSPSAHHRLMLTASSEDGGDEMELAATSEKIISQSPIQSDSENILTKDIILEYTSIKCEPAPTTPTPVEFDSRNVIERGSSEVISQKTQAVLAEPTDSKTENTPVLKDDECGNITESTLVIKEVDSHTTDLTPSSTHIKEKSSEMDTEKNVSLLRNESPMSDSDHEMAPSTPHSDISSGQMSKAPNQWDDQRPDSRHSDLSDKDPQSPVSSSSQQQFCFQTKEQMAMTSSLYGALPEDELQDTASSSTDKKSQGVRTDPITFKQESAKTVNEDVYHGFQGSPRHGSGEQNIHSPLNNGNTYDYEAGNDNERLPQFVEDVVNQNQDFLQTSSTTKPQLSNAFKSDQSNEGDDPIEGWGKPLGLPSPAPPTNVSTTDNQLNGKGTPKKERKMTTTRKTSEKLKESKQSRENILKSKSNGSPMYFDLAYVPHNGNSNYTQVEFFKKVRARYYVFSGLDPSREVYSSLLEAKESWDDKDLEVTIIPTYDTDTLGYWVAENEEALSQHKIDLSPSASRCTINLQDHETSCSAYRLEF